jgi:two-component system response regulator YesN
VGNLEALLTGSPLEDILRSFSGCTGAALSLLDGEGKELLRTDGECEYCRLISRYMPENACTDAHLAAGRRGVDFGGCYIFGCPANLYHMTFPLLRGEELAGLVLAGPFLMDAPDPYMFQDLSRRYPIPGGKLVALYEAAQTVPRLTPAAVNHISRLLVYLLSGLRPDAEARLRHNRRKLSQQSRINESIQMYKSFTRLSPEYPYDKERELIRQVKSGDREQAKATLNDLLGYVLFSQGRDIENIKNRALELCSLLSRASIEGGAATESTLTMSDSFIQSLQKRDNIEEICQLLSDIVEEFCENLFGGLPGGNEHTRGAMRYIRDKYASPITLKDVADHVHLHPAYLSALFKKSAGCSMREYITRVRMQQARRMLTHTDRTILDIAIAVGFDCQSYFTRVFKAETGLTPRQYRKQQPGPV